MGRWSARLAPHFIDFVDLRGCRRVLDVGCGTGVLCRAVLAATASSEVTGVDPAAAYIRHARSLLPDPRATFAVGIGEALGFVDASFDACMSLLVLQDVSDPSRSVGEMRRVTRPGGRVATCQWDFRDGMPMLSTFWDAVAAVDPETAAKRRAKTWLWFDREGLWALWRAAGLLEIETACFDIALTFASFDDFWSPFLSGATPTSACAAALPTEIRDALARHLRARLLGENKDGPFTLPARAWAVRGMVPRGQPPGFA